jgi:hypothetical protein
VLFARYAYGPNQLGYCGPDDAPALWQQATGGTPDADAGLRHLAAGFEGAYPYLCLIAASNGIADPLDRRVVEAYWLGNDLLRDVAPAAMSASIEARFRARVDARTWRWLSEKAPAGAKPVHAFHVLDVFPRVGLMRSGDLDDVAVTIDRCRIRWGRVIEREGDSLVVSAVPLDLVGGRFILGHPRIERVQAWRDGASLAGSVGRGDVVAIHWDWACDRLSDRQLVNLVGWTRYELDFANRTV